VDYEGQSKSQYVQDTFNRIAGRYDLLNSVMSLGMDDLWRRRAVRLAAVRPGQRVADICCGTGPLTRVLRSAVGESGQVTGLDFSEEMLAVARQRNTYSNVEFFQGDAMAIPLATGSFDAAFVGWGLRNVPDIGRVAAEMRRIIKPGGMVVSIDMAQPWIPGFREAYWLAFEHIVPRLGAFLAGGREKEYRYLFESAREFLSQRELAELFRRSGLVQTGWVNICGGALAMVYGSKSERYPG
jgi:demethylmenaquinone methyltransferase/2-methoxy-6-polyprenyl-1,4-benzoquinol methylase